MQLELAHAAKRILEREVAVAEADTCEVKRQLTECEAARAAAVMELEALRPVKEEVKQLQLKVRVTRGGVSVRLSREVEAQRA